MNRKVPNVMPAIEAAKAVHAKPIQVKNTDEKNPRRDGSAFAAAFGGAAGLGGIGGAAGFAGAAAAAGFAAAPLGAGEAAAGGVGDDAGASDGLTGSDI
jgi:hypothetical protein